MIPVMSNFVNLIRLCFSRKVLRGVPARRFSVVLHKPKRAYLLSSTAGSGAVYQADSGRTGVV